MLRYIGYLGICYDLWHVSGLCYFLAIKSVAFYKWLVILSLDGGL